MYLWVANMIRFVVVVYVINYSNMMTVAGETGKCGNCNCPTGTCAKEGSSESFFSVAGENGGKCGNCDCPAGTCAKEGSGQSSYFSVAGETGKCGSNCNCPAGKCLQQHLSLSLSLSKFPTANSGNSMFAYFSRIHHGFF